MRVSGVKLARHPQTQGLCGVRILKGGIQKRKEWSSRERSWEVDVGIRIIYARTLIAFSLFSSYTAAFVCLCGPSQLFGGETRRRNDRIGTKPEEQFPQFSTCVLFWMAKRWMNRKFGLGHVEEVEPSSSNLYHVMMPAPSSQLRPWRASQK